MDDEKKQPQRQADGATDKQPATSQARRAKHLAEIHKFEAEAERRLRAPLNGDRSFKFLR